MFFVYILYNSSINKYYTGYTANLISRIGEHSKNLHKTKFTRKQPGIWIIEYFEAYETKSEAIKREKQIKGWKSRKRIKELIKQSRL